MQHVLKLSDEEMGELDRLLVHEIDTTRVELRHTDNRGFRERVRHHLDVMEHLHTTVHAAEIEGQGYASFE